METQMQVYESPKNSTDTKPMIYHLILKAVGMKHEVDHLKSEIDSLFQQPQGPTSRLENLFTEADSILENHPELIQEVDQEQFERIEKLVEGVETDDLPTRLRALAERTRGVADGGRKKGNKIMDIELYRIAERIEGYAAELEKGQ